MVRFKWSICPSNSHLLGASNGGPTSPTALVTHCRSTLVRPSVCIPTRHVPPYLKRRPVPSTSSMPSLPPHGLIIAPAIPSSPLPSLLSLTLSNHLPYASSANSPGNDMGAAGVYRRCAKEAVSAGLSPREWSSRPWNSLSLARHRSGHTLTNSTSTPFVILFGGCESGRPPAPTSDVYKLDIQDPEKFYWAKVNIPGPSPTPRWHHSATLLPDGKTFVTFGGFGSKAQPLLNDVWLYDTDTDSWSQPIPGQTTENEGVVRLKVDWPGCPVPRGSHSAAVSGDKLYVFGGYGGAGFTRKDFNDLCVLDLSSYQWTTVETTGEVPEARSGHRAVTVDSKMYVMGGWNTVKQFDDMYIYDTETAVWSKPESACGEER